MGKKLAWSAGAGNGGQRLFIVPELDLSVVITAGAYNQPQIGRVLNQLLNQIVATIVRSPAQLPLGEREGNVQNNSGSKHSRKDVFPRYQGYCVPDR